VCTLSFFSANDEEPALSHKKLFLERIENQCPNLPFLQLNTSTCGAIVKPAHGTSVKVGVKLGEWSVSQCQLMGSPCMEQPYHPGPWEIRLYKSKQWHSSIAWLVPSGQNMNLDFPWIKDLQLCIDKALPLTSYLSVDVRSNGTDLLVLEVNGTAGMPYEWTLEQTSMPVDMWNWFYQRYSSGLQKLQWTKTLMLLCLVFQRAHLRQTIPKQKKEF
jgi:hypothetical protein